MHDDGVVAVADGGEHDVAGVEPLLPPHHPPPAEAGARHHQPGGGGHQQPGDSGHQPPHTGGPQETGGQGVVGLQGGAAPGQVPLLMSVLFTNKTSHI